MRIFKNKWFAKWARLERIEDAVLVKAVEEILAGKVEADLGKGLFKKRLARQGQGKRSGYRVILVYRAPDTDRIFFIDAFGKNEKANLSTKEFAALAKVASYLPDLSDDLIDQLKTNGDLFEIATGGPDEQTS